MDGRRKSITLDASSNLPAVAAAISAAAATSASKYHKNVTTTPVDRDPRRGSLLGTVAETTLTALDLKDKTLVAPTAGYRREARRDAGGKATPQPGFTGASLSAVTGVQSSDATATGDRRGVSDGLADVLARGSLAAAVSHAYLERQARLEQEALERDAGFGEPGDGKSASSAARRKLGGASLMTEEDRLKEARKEAINRYTEVKRREVAAGLRALAKVDPLVTRYHGLMCKLRDGHSLGVYMSQYADDGNLVVSASHDSTAICWDISRQEIRRTYRGHMGPVFSARWEPIGDNDRILTASDDSTVKLWEKRSGRCVATLREHDAAVYTAVWCHDGSMIATGGADRSIIIYDVAAVTAVAEKLARNEHVTALEEEERILVRIGAPPSNSDGHGGPIRRLLFLKTDDALLSASDDCKVKLWDIKAGPGGKLKRVFHAHSSAINDINVNPTEELMVTASSDGTAKVWSMLTGNVLRTLRGHVGVVYAALFTPEGQGRRIVTGGHDRCICVWEAGTGILFQRMEHVHLSWVLGLDVRIDGLQLISAAGDRTIGVWRALPLSVIDHARACVVDSSKKAFWAVFGGSASAAEVKERERNARKEMAMRRSEAQAAAAGTGLQVAASTRQGGLGSPLAGGGAGTPGGRRGSLGGQPGATGPGAGGGATGNGRRGSSVGGPQPVPAGGRRGSKVVPQMPPED